MVEDIFYVYQLRREDSQTPFYIGKGKNDRCFVHLTEPSLKKRCRKNSIIKKALAEGIQVVTEKLYTSITEDIAISLEIELIEKYGRLDNGSGVLSNMTDGGDGVSGRVWTTEQRLHAREKAIQRGISTTTRDKITKSLIGRKVSSETRLKMSESAKGRLVSEDTKEKLRTSSTGRTHSPDTRRKLSENAKFRIRKPFSEQTRERMRQSALLREQKRREGVSV